MPCADGLSLSWLEKELFFYKTIKKKKKKDKTTSKLKISPDDESSLPSGWRPSGRLAPSNRLQPHAGLTAVKLRIRVSYANSNHRTDISDGMLNSIR